MDQANTGATIDRRTLEGLLDDLREAHRRIGIELRKLETAEPLSDAYHDALAEVYTLMTWLEGLAPDTKTEISRLDDQLPDD